MFSSWLVCLEVNYNSILFHPKISLVIITFISLSPKTFSVIMGREVNAFEVETIKKSKP